MVVIECNTSQGGGMAQEMQWPSVNWKVTGSIPGSFKDNVKVPLRKTLNP